MTRQSWLIVGATSSMARAFAASVAAQGATVLLAGRDLPELARSAADCRLRGAAACEALTFDARKPKTFAALVDRLTAEDGTLNVAVFVGSMPDQDSIDADPGLIARTVEQNFTGPATLLHMLAPHLAQRGTGAVVGVGSVAGDRGRLGNYVYGAAKSGFATYLSGLRNRLAREGVHVMTVKPGFVDTAMTWGIEGMFLVASPDKIARDIHKGLKRRRNVLYTPFFWLGIMGIIRTIPEAIFKRLKI